MRYCFQFEGWQVSCCEIQTEILSPQHYSTSSSPPNVNLNVTDPELEQLCLCGGVDGEQVIMSLLGTEFREDNNMSISSG